MKKSPVQINKILQITCSFDEFDDSREKFICRQLDIFDHWLTEEEARDRVMSYPVLLEKKQDLSEFLSKEQLFLKFLTILFEAYNILLCKNGEHFVFENVNEFRKICIKSIREEELAVFHIPELDLTIYGNFDMNMPFNFCTSNPSAVCAVEDKLQLVPGLYLLG